jgi:hypothetical protein
MSVLQKDVAAALGVSTSHISALVRKGMPLSSTADAAEWHKQYLKRRCNEAAAPVLFSILDEIGASEHLQVFIDDGLDDESLKYLSKLKPERVSSIYGLSLDQAAAFAHKCLSVVSSVDTLPPVTPAPPNGLRNQDISFSRKAQGGSLTPARSYDAAVVGSVGGATQRASSGSASLTVAGAGVGAFSRSGAAPVTQSEASDVDMSGGSACQAPAWVSDSAEKVDLLRLRRLTHQLQISQPGNIVRTYFEERRRMPYSGRVVIHISRTCRDLWQVRACIHSPPFVFF